MNIKLYEIYNIRDYTNSFENTFLVYKATKFQENYTEKLRSGLQRNYIMENFVET